MFMQTDLLPSHKSVLKGGGRRSSNVHVHVHTLLTSHKGKAMFLALSYTLACYPGWRVTSMYMFIQYSPHRKATFLALTYTLARYVTGKEWEGGGEEG